MTHPEMTEDLCCVDERTGERALIRVDDAIRQGVALARPVVEVENLGLVDAIGRVLADDLHAPFALPPFDNSAMDGYAIRTTDLVGTGPWTLTVAGRVAAGDNAEAAGHVGPGEAFRIFTGAGLPELADAVIMQERVARDGDKITISEAVSSGSCIRRKGEDAREGTLLLPKGTLIGAPEIGAIASVGLSEIGVFRKLRVALLCTGSELRQPGETLASGQIYNSNRFILMAALCQPWIEIIDLGAVKDDPELLRETLTQAAANADVIVTTGGVSVGEEDHMVAQLRAAGGEIEVMKIAMKPGKPLSMGRLDNAVFIGLPGNPVAAFTTWKIIGAEVAATAAGLLEKSPRGAIVKAAENSTRSPGRQEFRPARIVGVSESGHPQVKLLDNSFSAKISLICKSDGFAVIPAETRHVRQGDQMDFVYL